MENSKMHSQRALENEYVGKAVLYVSIDLYFLNHTVRVKFLSLDDTPNVEIPLNTQSRIPINSIAIPTRRRRQRSEGQLRRYINSLNSSSDDVILLLLFDNHRLSTDLLNLHFHSLSLCHSLTSFRRLAAHSQFHSNKMEWILS